MVNKIITGISQKLDAIFNISSEEYTIYTENVEQDLKEPCFFIFCLKPDNSQLIGNRYKRNYPFDIQYLPKDSENINSECNEVAEKLINELEYITVDGSLVRGTKMNGETVDNVLHFFVNYNMIVRKDIPKEETMGDLTITQKLGGN